MIDNDIKKGLYVGRPVWFINNNKKILDLFS